MAALLSENLQNQWKLLLENPISKNPETDFGEKKRLKKTIFYHKDLKDEEIVDFTHCCNNKMVNLLTNNATFWFLD